jgi:hypothetical protein
LPWQARATPNAEAVRYPSFARASQEFCVPRSSKSGEINHEAREGHEEFARVAVGSVVTQL